MRMSLLNGVLSGGIIIVANVTGSDWEFYVIFLCLAGIVINSMLDN